MQEAFIEHAKFAGDVAAGGIALATLVAWLPPIAALLTIVYTAMRIYTWIRQKEYGPKK